MIDIDKLLIRASASGEIMTPGNGEITLTQLETIKELTEKSKVKPLTPKQTEELMRLINKRDNPKLSGACITRLLKTVAAAMGREEEIKNKYMTKGTEVEEDTITLYARVKKVVLTKNSERFNNKYLTGEPDSSDHENIREAEEIIDFKSSWSLITFLKAKADILAGDTNFDYEWQGHSYMGLLPKAKRHRVVYGLVNSPAELIVQEKKNLRFRMPEVIDPDAHPEFIEGCQQIERNHIFDMGLFRSHYPWFEFHTPEEEWVYDIPMADRIVEFVVDRDNDKIDKLYHKIERGRKWLKEEFFKQ